MHVQMLLMTPMENADFCIEGGEDNYKKCVDC